MSKTEYSHNTDTSKVESSHNTDISKTEYSHNTDTSMTEYSHNTEISKTKYSHDSKNEIKTIKFKHLKISRTAHQNKVNFDHRSLAMPNLMTIHLKTWKKISRKLN